MDTKITLGSGAVIKNAVCQLDRTGHKHRRTQPYIVNKDRRFFIFIERFKSFKTNLIYGYYDSI